MKNWLIIIACVAAIGCGKDSNNNSNPNNSSDAGDDSANNVNNVNNVNNETDGGTDGGDTGPVVKGEIGCDPIDPAACAFPWPSNLYLEEDADRPTGYTLAFGERTLPQTRQGDNWDPTPFRRMDGYGLGASLMAFFPELNDTNLPDENAIAASLEDDAQIVWLELDAQNNVVGRVPYWVDFDAQENDTTKKMVYVKPAVVLKEATRYVVAFRNLTDTNGAPIPTSEGFQNLLDGTTDSDPQLFWRQERFDDIFGILQTEGVEKSTLNLAWDFVTASTDGLHGYMVQMRDESIAALPDGPQLNIETVEEFTVDENANIQFEMRGTVDVPHYMAEDADSPGRYRFNLDAAGAPSVDGTLSVPFWVRVPRSAVNAANPHDLVLYGHGLLGSGTQVRGGHNSLIANTHDMIFFAADLAGMSSEEGSAAALDIIQDFSRFPWFGDRLHQGVLNWVMLTRSMKAQFATHPEVTSRNIVASTETYYSGISQGGIFGTTFVAVSPDVSRGHLGVPGSNYSVLLHRSVDFQIFFAAMRASYPSKYEQGIALGAVQLLWDGTDPISYFRKISDDPFPTSGPNAVIMAPAKGDYQVAVVQNEVVARTDIGIPLMQNYDDERTPDLTTEEAYPRTGSGVVLWDFNDPWPAAGNRSDVFDYSGVCGGSGDCDQAGGYRCCAGTCCRDPHGKPRRVDQHSQQMADFFRTGIINDVCGGDGCRPDDYPTVP